MAEVELSNLTKIYPGPVRAVSGVSLLIHDRELLVVVGPSGGGKTTTLRMIAGLEDATAGTIRIGGRVVNDVAPKDRDLAMVFQNCALYPHMTVAQNLAFGLLLRRRHALWDNPLAFLLAHRNWQQARAERAAIDRRVRETAQMLGISDLLRRRPRALSGGERQRVAVGRAIVRQPQAFLLDEPLSNLDARLRVMLRGELKQLHRQAQTTTIYVTHDQEEAMTLGDRVVVMHTGVVQQCGPPGDIYERPLNRFVAGFFGTAPMNFLEGRLARRSGSAAAPEELLFEHGARRWPVCRAHRDRLAGYVGQPLVLGIRPESIQPGDTKAPACLPAQVRRVEPLGDRCYIHGATDGGAQVVCCCNARTPVAEGEIVALMMDMSRAHYFLPGEFGRNLLT